MLNFNVCVTKNFVTMTLVEEERVADARRVLDAAQQSGRRLLLPGDHICAPRLEAAAPRRVAEQSPEGEMGLDIGPATAARYAEVCNPRMSSGRVWQVWFHFQHWKYNN